MALGDIVAVDLMHILQGDTWEMEVLDAPGQGVWIVRDGDIDLDERSGSGLLLAQGDIVRFRAWWEARPAAGVELFQYGVDQYGRLVGDLRYEGDGSNWSVVCFDEGRGSYVDLQPSGSEATTRWSPRRTGAGIADQLTIDLTLP